MTLFSSVVVFKLLMLLLLLSMTALLANGQLPETKCVLDCLPVDPADLTYCRGVVDYTACLSPRDVTARAADARAFNNSQTMPRDSNEQPCLPINSVMLPIRNLHLALKDALTVWSTLASGQ